MSETNPEPMIRDLYAVEAYQADEVPPEYSQWHWRGIYRCTLVNYWTPFARRQ
jgi:hypothetical protein